MVNHSSCFGFAFNRETGMGSEEKPKFELVSDADETAEISAEQSAYEGLMKAAMRRHPSALPPLAGVEVVKDENDSQQ